ncbi:MAG: hypothetical protein WCA38_14850 [Candidatus Acidiferrales bacterium]
MEKGDIGMMPYDCFTEKNLHCSPLKVFDYFLAGLSVLSTPTMPLWDFEDLIHFDETEREFSSAIRRALDEPAQSPKRRMRMAHSTESLAKRLEELEVLLDARPGSAN